jgi:hypothetical protein
MSSVDHLRLEQFHVSDVGVGTLELDDFTDLCHFLGDERGVDIAFTMHQSEDTNGVFPSILLG